MLPTNSTHTEPVGVGLVFDLRNPAPWAQSWSAMYAWTLDLIEEADRLGLSSAWLSEHHLWEDGYLPQPLTFAAAIAARTRNMRIGTSIMNGALHNPMEIAEQAAVVDILSDGRLELGLGAGYAASEFEAYGVDVRTRRTLFRAAVRSLPHLWQTVTPRPVQTQIPLWIGAMGPKMASFAGSVSAGLLISEEPAFSAYKAALPDPDSARCVDMVGFILSDDPERTWAQVVPHLEWIVKSYDTAGGQEGTSLQIDYTNLRQRTGIPVKPAMDVVTPDEALQRLTPMIQKAPIKHIQLPGDLAGLPEAVIERHVELVGKHLVGALTRTA
ncbi:LLM class flavin-dependent oxidoreductase [Mycolicibacterium litorale]|uniref:LLM class flavin-dependent oxidoreductase n=1 Tax=Mycolicibacterium litorale TaxID=758802 RepID=UPI003CF8B1D3